MATPEQRAKLIIDGYNVMYAAGMIDAQKGRTTLKRRRAEFLRFLAGALGDERERTVVVFDAGRAGGERTARFVHQGMLVRFAADYEDADALIEEIIAHHSAPRRLTVVSSDHRLQRAARRRKAQAMDSESWLQKIEQGPRQASTPARPAKPPPPASEEEVDYWLSQFEDDEH